MTQKYLIGVDIGTQGTKTTLISTEGQIIADAFEASKLIRPKPGVVEQDPGEMFDSVIRTISKVVKKSGTGPSDILALGVDGQMAGIMGVDKDWNAVTHYDSWLDTRCEKYIEQIKAEAEDKVVSITGCPVTYAHGPKVLWWKNERPDVYKNIAKFILPAVYVIGRLAGLRANQAYIDYTYLHFSGFGDVKEMKWSDELLGLFKVEKDKMPEIVEPWRIVGKLTKEAAQVCGLASGIPLVAGCGDSAATSLGAGITRPGLLFDVAGTASIFSCCVERYRPDVQTKTLLFPRSVVPGLWIPLAYINGGGMCLKWFRDNLTGNDRMDYAELDKAAERIPPGSEGLVFLPHFSGRVCPNNPNIRGSWLGLNWVHTRDHMYRAIMEGIAYEYHLYLKIIKEVMKEVKFTQVFAIGGGAKSRLFNSIKADVLGVNYTPLMLTDAATIGSAVVAGYGVKVYDDFHRAMEKFIRPDTMVEYNPKRHEAYKPYTEIYEKIFDALGPVFRSLTSITRSFA